MVLVTAHLDSINLAGGPQAQAPGADDNGSGSAGLLTIARIFAGHQGVADLRLILFGGEEQGLFGSRQYVAGLEPAERSRIAAVVNMDMIGTVNTADTGGPDGAHRGRRGVPAGDRRAGGGGRDLHHA